MGKKNIAGSSLIEIIVATSLLIMILLPVYERFFDIFVNQEINNQYLIANGMLENKISFFKTQTKDQLTLGEQNETILALPAGNLNINISDYDVAEPTIYRIDLNLTWQGKGSAKEAELTTLINL